MKWDLLCIAFMAVIFGAYSLWLGYDTIVIGGVFALLGTIAGYVVGKTTKETEEESSETVEEG